MSYTLNIPDHLYKMLKEAADASGLTPVEWIASRLPPVPSEAGISAEPPAGSLTLADLLEGRVGHIRSGGQGRLSKRSGEKFTDYLAAKRRAGH